MGITKTLIPHWDAKQNGAMADRSERPVLIALERTGAFLRGQILSISSTHAEILPDDTCHLFRKIGANLRFRIGETEFSLTGMAISCEPRRTIVLELDRPTRTNLALMRSQGIAPMDRALGHFPAGGTGGAPVVRRRSKEEQRTVLHLPPPNGIERRIEPRFNLDVRASLYLCEAGGMLSCTTLEVSRTGARLFFENPPLLQADTHVELAFRGNGEFHRISAQVRPKLDTHLTGLLFVDLNARRQTRIDDMVDELRKRNGKGMSYLDV